MKVPKSIVGKLVEVTWRDPSFARISCPPLLLPEIALATAKDRGVVDNLKDGVIRLIHADTRHDPNLAAISDEMPTVTYQVSWIHESMVESITVFEPSQVIGEETKTPSA